MRAFPIPARLAQDQRYFTLHDLKRSRQLAGTLFNVLFNLSKFMAYETRDPFVSRQVLRALGCGQGHVQGAQAAGLAGEVWPRRLPAPLLPPTPPPQEREDGLTEWDRFARTEYLRLAMEEDADNDAGSDGAWSRLDAL